MSRVVLLLRARNGGASETHARPVSGDIRQWVILFSLITMAVRVIHNNATADTIGLFRDHMCKSWLLRVLQAFVAGQHGPASTLHYFLTCRVLEGHL